MKHSDKLHNAKSQLLHALVILLLILRNPIVYQGIRVLIGLRYMVECRPYRQTRVMISKGFRAPGLSQGPRVCPN